MPQLLLALRQAGTQDFYRQYHYALLRVIGGPTPAVRRGIPTFAPSPTKAGPLLRRSRRSTSLAVTTCDALEDMERGAGQVGGVMVPMAEYYFIPPLPPNVRGGRLPERIAGEGVDLPAPPATVDDTGTFYMFAGAGDRFPGAWQTIPVVDPGSRGTEHRCSDNFARLAMSFVEIGAKEHFPTPTVRALIMAHEVPTHRFVDDYVDIIRRVVELVGPEQAEALRVSNWPAKEHVIQGIVVSICRDGVVLQPTPPRLSLGLQAALTSLQSLLSAIQPKIMPHIDDGAPAALIYASYDCGTAASDFPDHLATRKVFIYVLEFRPLHFAVNEAADELVNYGARRQGAGELDLDITGDREEAAKRKRLHTYPELAVARRCKLVVLALEVGG
ncbi:unnamed protein product, partial [Symbiodinium microadriaticum]